ncbi:gamma-glutamylcyclotransferase [Roseivivax sp. GX 12232]|uniref:gamma-glutamylcyclotransferase n=1 Tax=Roseivivax sp. GX 12232 TaxID=2900547 RepID=UPI001E577B3D|nr:gamma-glutamylcyclotransferase [Roseivivax sp. GX 12232]
MTHYFLFGTLRHAPLLTAVAGREVAVTPARLPGRAAHWVAGAAYPVLIESPGAAEGQLVTLDAEAARRVDYYEEGFGYLPQDLEVETEAGRCLARVYVPAEIPETGAPFEIADWSARWGAIATSAAEEIMARFGHEDASAAHALWPVFAARGWAREMGRDPAPAALRTDMGERGAPEVKFREGGHDGFFRLRRFDVRFPQYQGGQSRTVTREAFCAFDAALVLPYDPVTDQVLLIEQFRYGPLMRDDPRPWVLEPVAGLVDAGEPPIETARREALEEAHLELSDIRPMLKVYASPGYSSEFFHCFLGLADLDGRGVVHAGLDQENEDIRSHVLPFEEALGHVESGEINAGPLAMMLLWLARERAGLRAGA